MYDEDYLYFFAAPGDLRKSAEHGPAVPGADLPGEAAAALAWRLLDLGPGISVLDLAGPRRSGTLTTPPIALSWMGSFAHRVNFVKRLFGFPELRDWLLAAGFTVVTGYGEDGRPLAADHKRMVIVAEMP